MRQLNNVEIHQIKKGETVNNRRDTTQNIVIKEWFKKGGRGWFSAFTSFGKSHSICKIISIINKQKPEATICIIVPSTDLKDDLEADVLKFELLNTKVHVVNSFSMNLVKNDESKYFDLLICDELHTLCGTHSKYFSQVIPRLNYKWFLGVSATLEKSHVEYLKSYELEGFFDIPIEDGYRCEVVPEYVIYNLAVQFTDHEKQKYIKIQKEYQNILAMFMMVDQFKPYDAIAACLGPKDKLNKFGEEEVRDEWGNVTRVPILKTAQQWCKEFAPIINKTDGVVKFYAMRWQKLVGERRSLLNNATNSINTVIQLAKLFDEPTLIVMGGQESAKYVSSQLYNSTTIISDNSAKNNKINKKEFTENKKKYAVVSKKLKQGYNKPDLWRLIRQGITSSQLDLTQWAGRLFRMDDKTPDKCAVFVQVYVDDFTYNGVLYTSQQKVWCKSSVYGKAFVEWINSISEIKC